MNGEDRRLMVETLAEMKELKGALGEFKEHVLGRVEKLENSEGKRRRERATAISILIASGALLLNVLDKIFH
jgi:hypothetical protein